MQRPSVLKVNQLRLIRQIETVPKHKISRYEIEATSINPAGILFAKGLSKENRWERPDVSVKQMIKRHGPIGRFEVTISQVCAWWSHELGLDAAREREVVL